MKDLLSEADLPSVNQIVARSAITLMWTAMVKNVGPLVSTYAALRPASKTRAANDGKLNTPDGSNAIITSGQKLWNEFHGKIVNIKTKPALKSFIKKEVWPKLPI